MLQAKRKFCLLYIFLAGILVFTGCSAGGGSDVSSSQQSDAPSASVSSSPAVSSDESDEDSAPVDRTPVRVGVLKGPTGMGMVGLMDASDKKETQNDYRIELIDAPDKVAPMLINGQLDIAALPVNMASVVYNRTEKGVTMLNVNTLGVLHLLTSPDETVQSVADLKGKTIYSTGQGASPEYVLNYILNHEGLDPETDVTIEYKSEHAELATLLAAGEVSIAILPEPFVTTVTMQNPELKIALDLSDLWEEASNGAVQTTGCIVVRNAFLEERPEAVALFQQEYKASTQFVNDDPDAASLLIEQYEIIAKAEVAKRAIPRCNISFIDGTAMKEAAGIYLEALFEANPQSVGGSLPDDTFYYQA